MEDALSRVRFNHLGKLIDCRLSNELRSRFSHYEYFGLCAGFSDAGMTMPITRSEAGVREAPRHEVARCGAPAAQRALQELGVGVALDGRHVASARPFGSCARWACRRKLTPTTVLRQALVIESWLRSRSDAGRSFPMTMDEQGTSSFADRPGVGAVIISVMLTISIVASIYICFVAR